MCFVVHYKDSFYTVLDIKSANNFVLDFNHNHSFDDNEDVVLNNVKVCTTEKLSEEEMFIFNQLALNFAKDFFFNKKVRYVKNDLIADGVSYFASLNAAGFNANFAPEKNKELIDYIRSNKFYVVNLHNYRYHKYGCKHYLKVDKYALFELGDMPAKYIPCSYCLKRNKSKTRSMKPEKGILKGSVELILTDNTSNFVPTNECSSNVCKALLRRIDETKSSLDFAIYGYFDVPEIYSAIERAIKRGVKVRMVYDLNSKGETDYLGTKELAALVKNSVNDFAAESPKGRYANIIMHNKFYIFDEKSVMTGSANLSKNDMSAFNSNSVLIIDSPEVARIYQAEFAKLYEGIFHKAKNKTVNNKNLSFGDSKLSVYFSPQDKVTKNYIIPLVRSAQVSISIPAFLITDKMLSEELKQAALRGVEVRVILDASSASSPYSQIKNLRDSGIKVKVENFAGKLHSKSMIIDDETLVIGSMNFSLSGQNYNDENTVILRNKRLAREYNIFFDSLWARIDDKWLNAIPMAEGKDSIGSCADGVDNDYDGLIDSADDGCK